MQSIDHRDIGTQQELFFFHKYSPGSCIFLPDGTIILNNLQRLMREEYKKRGFLEVSTPQMFNAKLWETSGHLGKYEENMFKISNCSDDMCCMKPMNCPTHCLIFKHQKRSYRELPLRLADFGVLHRNELTGTLTGLTRVRKFCQDDAHIFCTEDQIGSEINSCFDFIEKIYKIFGFEFSISLSTRPDAYIGDLELWNKAEECLRTNLERWGKPYVVNEGDGAFYGPKIDFYINDSNGKKHQCGTIQLDFNLPKRFKLKYTNAQDKIDVPVMIHRAVYGSFERFFGILCEHYAGKFPFWMSPKQVMIIPINETCIEYAKEIKAALYKYYVDIDFSGNTLKKKIVNAEQLRYNYILVVGEKEIQNKNMNVRFRNVREQKTYSMDQLLSEFKRNQKTFL
uniref:threonine--tRNA ligase n=1 Tax=viral metagenome TaxID=1070528 RepID=A0A6C0C8P6_9ZZZZ